MTKAALIQMQIGDSLAQNLETARKSIEDAASEGANIVCMPEYFFAAPRVVPLQKFHDETYGEVVEFIENISGDLDLTITSNVIERSGGRYYNVCMVYESGKLIGRQRKVNVTQNEGLWGLGSTPNKKFEIFKSRLGNLGVLVCADVLHAECCAELRGADIVFNPVVSKYRKKDATAVGRIAMFIARAYDNGYFILKAGGVGRTPFARIVGRSLIAAPWGIVACARDENTAEIVTAELDVNLLRKVRNENEALATENKGKEMRESTG